MKDNIDEIARAMTPLALVLAGGVVAIASLFSPGKDITVQIAGLGAASTAFASGGSLARSPNDKKQGVGDGAKIENLEIK